MLYRPEIDGLRAIAVLSVLFYHAEFILFGRDWFVGGFAGVDIFFVISGYLISKIILLELEETNRCNLLAFYERRARRILPMLLVVILVSIPFAWELLRPTAFIEFSKSAIASLLFVSNIFFYNNAAGYGTEAALLKPLLHTWSLSVEEQFYILFPIGLIGLYKWRRSLVPAVFAICICISLLLADVISMQNQPFSFYWLPTRLWELLIGGLLAYADIKYGRNWHKGLHQTLPVIGLFMIACSILFLDAQTRHPGLLTTLPVIGTALIIFFANSGELVGRVLSTKAFVAVGLISYSLYLWHYPIFAFSRIRESYADNFDKLEWLVLAFVMSTGSYYLIERPFRNKASWPTRRFFSTLGVVFPSTALVIAVLFPYDFDYEDIEEHALDNPILMTDYTGYLNNWFAKKDIEKNAFTDPDRTNVLIIGNSHGTDIYNAVKQNADLFDELEVVIIHHGQQALSTSPQYQVSCFLRFLKTRSNTCHGVAFWTRAVLEKMYQDADVVLFSTRWSWKDIDALQEIIPIIEGDGKRAVITSNSPEQPHTNLTKGDTPLKNFIKAYERLPDKAERLAIERETFQNASENTTIIEVNKRLIEIASRNNVIFLDTMDYICDVSEKKCRVLTPKGHLINWDYAHYSINGAKFVGSVMKEINWLEPLRGQGN